MLTGARLGLWRRQPCGDGERQKETLELSGGEGNSRPLEKSPQARDPWPAGQRVEGFAQLLRVDQIAMVGLVDRRFDLAVRQVGGEVDQGGDGVSDGNAINLPPPGRFVISAPVRADAGPIPGPARWNHHVGVTRP